MSENARLRTEIQARKFRLMDLTSKIDRKIREIQAQLYGYPLVKIADIQLALIRDLASEASELKTEYIQCLSEIETAEKELA